MIHNVEMVCRLQLFLHYGPLFRKLHFQFWSSPDRRTVPPRWQDLSLGAVAQLGERLVRNEEAVGSIPISSTYKAGTDSAS